MSGGRRSPNARDDQAAGGARGIWRESVASWRALESEGGKSQPSGAGFALGKSDAEKARSISMGKPCGEETSALSSLGTSSRSIQVTPGLDPGIGLVSMGARGTHSTPTRSRNSPKDFQTRWLMVGPSPVSRTLADPDSWPTPCRGEDPCISLRLPRSLEDFRRAPSAFGSGNALHQP